MIGTRLDGATLRDCGAYGVSLWGAQGIPATQERLRITAPDDALIAVDDLSVALFVQLICESAAVQGVVDRIHARTVLVCGRFDEQRYRELDDVRSAIHGRGLHPVVFDLRGQVTDDTAGALATLGAASKLVVLDISDAGRPPEALVEPLRSMPTPTLPVVMTGRGSEWREMQAWRAEGTNILPLQQYADASSLANVVGSALPS